MIRIMKMRYQLEVFIFILIIVDAISKDLRIVGGQDADVRTYPFTAYFKYIGNSTIFCGGVIISNKHILTTAQCLRRDLIDYRRVRIYTGMAPTASNPGSIQQIVRVYTHPGFLPKRSYDEMFLHDVAVAKLKSKIEFNEFQNAIELLNRDVIENDSGFVLGWGSTTYPTTSYPLRMQMANMTIVPEREFYKYFKFIIHDTQFCAFQRDGVGACIGDGGSPFIIDGKLGGLVSLIYRCADGVPEVYTKIYYYIDFITDMMNR